MTTSIDEAAMRRACAVNPQDDAGWLALADCLQESSEGAYKPCPKCKNGRIMFTADEDIDCFTCKGTGTAPDTSRADRAELIRVQVELTGTPARTACSRCRDAVGGCPQCSGHGQSNSRHIRLRERESAIIAANPTWTPKCAACDGNGRGMNVPPSEDDAYLCSSCFGTGKAPCTWRAGYVAVVSVPTIASVLKRISHVCPSCSGTSRTSSIGGSCADCRIPGDFEATGIIEGDWQPTNYARYLHDNFSPTLTGVMPMDRNPNATTYPNRPCWYVHSTDHLEYDHWLPPILLEPMQKASGCLGSNTGVSGHVFEYTTTELANTALAKALRDVVWEKLKENR